MVAAVRVDYSPLEFLNRPPFLIQFSFMSLLGKRVEQAKVILFDPNTHQIISELETDKSGMKTLIKNDIYLKYDTLIGFDQWSSDFDDDDQDEEAILGEHGSQES